MRWWPSAKVETKSLAAPDEELLQIFGIVTPDLISRSTALEVPAVQAAIRTISEACATLDVSVVTVDASGTETVAQDHSVAGLLQRPNDWTGKFEFIRDLVVQALTNDVGGIAWVNRVENKPVEAILYQPGKISVTVEDTGEPAFMLDSRTLQNNDVIWLRGPFSKCPLSMAMRAISMAYHLESHGVNLFKNGARPGGTLEVPANTGEKAIKTMKAAWDRAFKGSTRTGETAILFDGTKFVPYTLASTDAQYLENRRFQIEEIARAFNIPAPMIGDLSRATWSNSEHKGREFLSYCLEPWLQALEACLTRALFTDDERKQGYRVKFDRDDLTRASLTERATAINSLIASETINPNTGRDWLGLAPYDGGEAYGNRNITVKPAKESV